MHYCIIYLRAERQFCYKNKNRESNTMKEITAKDLLESAFDSSNDYIETTTEYVCQYADGALDVYCSKDVAKKILEVYEQCECDNEFAPLLALSDMGTYDELTQNLNQIILS